LCKESYRILTGGINLKKFIIGIIIALVGALAAAIFSVLIGNKPTQTGNIGIFGNVKAGRDVIINPPPINTTPNEPSKKEEIDRYVTLLEKSLSGWEYLDQKDYDRALNLFSESIGVNPNDVFSYTYRSLVYYLQSKYDLAIADLNSAIKINPNYAPSYVYRGNIYGEIVVRSLSVLEEKVKEDLYNSAMKDLNKAVEIDPKFASGYIYRGLTYFRLDKYDLAIADFNKAEQIDPSNVLTYFYRVLLFMKLGEKDLMFKNIGKTLELEPDIMDKLRDEELRRLSELR